MIVIKYCLPNKSAYLQHVCYEQANISDQQKHEMSPLPVELHTMVFQQLFYEAGNIVWFRIRFQYKLITTEIHISNHPIEMPHVIVISSNRYFLLCNWSGIANYLYLYLITRLKAMSYQWRDGSYSDGIYSSFNGTSLRISSNTALVVTCLWFVSQQNRERFDTVASIARLLCSNMFFLTKKRGNFAIQLISLKASEAE